VRRAGTLGFLHRTADDDDRQENDKIEKALKSTFRPEFLNRIDEVIMFSPLSLEEMEQIVDLQLKEVQDRLNEYNIQVSLTPAARSWLAKEGYDPTFGARPLRRALQKHVESPLSVELLGGKFAGGGTVLVDVDPDSGRIIFHNAGQSAAKIKQPANA
jgi:ATP-dependent Clp protease ATP-binding subunit ClpC